MFLGIALGVVVGSIPLPVRGLPAPLRLGLAGGPLVVAIALSARARIGPLTWRMSPEASTLLRDVGIALFLSCVGLIAGRRLVETLTVGDGVRWMAWATLITLTPMILAAVAARGLLKADYASTCGLMAGSMTDPAALAFSWSVTKSDATMMAYATVYPLTMVLRVLSTQVFVLLLTR
jgi:putative transport protein